MRATTGAGAVHGVPVHRFPSPLRRLVSLLGAVALLIAPPALAEKRVALVIGNAAYKHAPALANPKNDAEAMAAALKRLGFEVLVGTDLDKASTDRLLEAFEKSLDGAEVALFFYAGHGLQVNGRNFLVPVDAKLEREAQLNFQAVALDLVQTLMEQTQRTNVIILDACRDNPLARSLARSMGTRSTAIGNGLAQAQGGRGTLIVYATQPGNVALDGTGRNSPFTTALLEHIETPGLEVRQVLTRVRASVTKATGDKQLPWEATSLIGDFYFARGPASPEAKPPAPASVTPPPFPATPAPDQETVFWQSIKDSKNAADYRAYLARYPQGAFAELAKLRIAEIEKAASVTPPAPRAPEPETPVPPQAPRRTSTFEHGVMILLGPETKALTYRTVGSAQACAELCIKTPQCAAWTINNFGMCTPLTAAKDRLRHQQWTSGVIRTTTAVAPYQPPAPKAQPSTAEKPSTPQSGDPLVRELIRKATAREKETGFCARVSWTPYYGTYCELEKLLGSRPSGLVATRGVGIVSGACVVTQVSAETREGGKRYRFFQQWSCTASGCNSYPNQRIDLSTCQ